MGITKIEKHGRSFLIKKNNNDQVATTSEPIKVSTNEELIRALLGHRTIKDIARTFEMTEEAVEKIIDKKS